MSDEKSSQGPGPIFSARTEWERTPTLLARRYAELMGTRSEAGAGAGPRGGVPVIDLTESNPTRAGFVYPENAIRTAISPPASLLYEPEPRGLARAREVVAARTGVDPERIVLTASTSEAYAWLFKLLCGAGSGEEVLIPSPSYPLFDYIAQVEGVRVARYPLVYEGGRWRLEIDDLARVAGPRARALIVVQPNNPTGSALREHEIAELDRFCAEQGLAIISDEVFADYPFDPAARIASIARSADSSALTFTLGGLSKAAGLPQMKLSWIVAGGPAAFRDEALGRLEVIGDTFLSIGTPVQQGVEALLEVGEDVRRQILARVRANRESAANICRDSGSFVQLLDADGGWYAVLRVPRVKPDEEWALELLENDRVYVHPGYLFDFDGDGHLVVSLLPLDDAFAEGIRRIVDRVAMTVR